MGLFNFMHKHCGRHHGQASDWYLKRIGKKLQLDESQRSRLSALQNIIDSSQSYLADIHKDRDDLLDSVFTDSGFDRESALHYFNAPRQAFEEQVPAIVDSLDEFYQSLKPRQREQLRDLLHKRYRQASHCCH
ncbi:Spy/CpxP family protein refolding chaperone [Kaarinaea lacus]